MKIFNKLGEYNWAEGSLEANLAPMLAEHKLGDNHKALVYGLNVTSDADKTSISQLCKQQRSALACFISSPGNPRVNEFTLNPSMLETTAVKDLLATLDGLTMTNAKLKDLDERILRRAYRLHEVISDLTEVVDKRLEVAGSTAPNRGQSPGSGDGPSKRRRNQ